MNSIAGSVLITCRNLKGVKMISTITDLALDLGQFALDNQLENKRTSLTTFTDPIRVPGDSPTEQTIYYCEQA